MTARTACILDRFSNAVSTPSTMPNDSQVDRATTPRGADYRAYRVGGYVRDHLLGRDHKDCDWVVVGATPATLREHGFRSVGRDFPVFLHPETNEEYALARTRRHSSRNDGPPVPASDPSVTLDEDLSRRDFTINAMAMDDEGRIIDPFGGRDDLRDGIIRHVGDAFDDDPLRILRGARFAARYGFRIAPETAQRMQALVAAGAVDGLVAERVWAELHKALAENGPARFFVELHRCGALARLLPELGALDGVPQVARFHPEIDTFRHVLMALDQATALSADPTVRFAVLVHDLGKGLTPPEQWPRHHGHEETGVPLVRAVAQRLRVPNAFAELGVAVCANHLLAHRAFELRPGTLARLFERLDAYRRPGRVEAFCVACEADARGRLGLDSRPYPQRDYLLACFEASRAVTAPDVVGPGMTGPRVGMLLHEARVRAIKAVDSSRYR